MSEKKKFPVAKVLEALAEKGSNFLSKNIRKIFILAIVFFLYVFVVVIFKSSSQRADDKPMPKQYSYLYLMEYINGWRDAQQDFEIEDLRFGEKFLSYTVNLNYQAKSVLLVKRLAVDMVVGLKKEYPELETISVKVIRNTGEKLTIYGRAVYSGSDDEISWKYQ